jgi:hypothetical protein
MKEKLVTLYWKASDSPNATRIYECDGWFYAADGVIDCSYPYAERELKQAAWFRSRDHDAVMQKVDEQRRMWSEVVRSMRPRRGYAKS